MYDSFRLRGIYTRVDQPWGTINVFPMFTRSLRNAEHTRRYTIAETSAGWEVRQEQDSQVVRRVHYHDWHRVERARRSIAHELNELEAAGWRPE